MALTRGQSRQGHKHSKGVLVWEFPIPSVCPKPALGSHILKKKGMEGDNADPSVGNQGN